MIEAPKLSEGGHWMLLGQPQVRIYAVKTQIATSYEDVAERIGI